MSCGVGGGGIEPVACAAICAHDAFAVRPPLKFLAFTGLVLKPTELLMMVTSFWMFCAHFAASWICWRTSLIAGYRNTLPMSTRVDATYCCTIFHGTWFTLPLSTSCSWLHTSLRYVACSLMCSGPLFTCGHLGAITPKSASKTRFKK